MPGEYFTQLPEGRAKVIAMFFDLQPCPTCLRHRRSDGSSCPFCGSSRALARGPKVQPQGAFGRRALMVAGVAAMAGVLGCGSSTGVHDRRRVDPADAGEPPDARVDLDGSVVAAYGTPPMLSDAGESREEPGWE